MGGKKPATPAQLAALEKARAVKARKRKRKAKKKEFYTKKK